MNRHFKLAIMIAVSIVMIYSLPAFGGETRVDKQALVKNDLYHIGWVWPDSLLAKVADFVVDDSLIYVLDEKGTLYCLRENGETIWSYRGDYKYASSILSVTNDAVLFIGGSNRYRNEKDQLFSVSKDGTLLWKFRGDNEFYYNNCYSTESGDFYIPARDKKKQWFYNRPTGYYRITPFGEGHYYDWPITGQINFGGIDSQNRLVVSDSSQMRLMLLSPNGEIVDSCIESERKWDPILYIYVNGDRIYLIDDNARLFALDDDLKILWICQLEGDPLLFYRGEIITDTNNDILVLTRDGKISLIDRNNGAVRWQNDLESYVTETAAILSLLDGKALIVGDRGTLSILDNTGNLIWHYTMFDPGMLSTPYLLPNGGFCVTQNGRIYGFTSDTSQIIPEPDPIPVPTTLAEAEQEVISFVLDYIVGDEVTSLADFIENEEPKDNMPQLTPPHENLIVYYPRQRGHSLSNWTMKYDKPIKVWINIGNMLIEQSDKLDAIDKYKNRNKTDSMVPWRYAIYNFCIISIDDSFQKAEIQLDFHCGMLCGNGDHYVLQRTPSGKWQIISSHMTRIS